MNKKQRRELRKNKKLINELYSIRTKCQNLFWHFVLMGVCQEKCVSSKNFL